MSYIEYENWMTSPIIDDGTKSRLMLLNEAEKEDAFYKMLSFGTGGLRGLIGDGNNRMNIYTVRHTTRGLSAYLNDKFASLEQIKVVIAYDSRNKSDIFAREAALTLANHGIKAYIFESLRTTPELSFAVRELECQAGIVITASHNPKEYNGYKVYGPDGCQITLEFAKGIMAAIQQYNLLECINNATFDSAVSDNMIEYIGEHVDQAYINKVLSLANKKVSKNVQLVYTPLHGTGLMPVKRVLETIGYENLHILKSQEEPDGNFPTVISPNPEEEKALSLAIEYAESVQADLVLGTDPDCDRVGIAVKSNDAYILLNGNQIGSLLVYYLLNSGRTISKNATLVKTIVTSELGAQIAKRHGLKVINTLTGFKFIGEKIGEFENDDSHEFFFGYEESYGYLTGTFVRDKDAVISSMLITEMTSFYKEQGKTLLDVLNDIYQEYGYYKEILKTITLPGIEGKKKIDMIMSTFKETNKLINIFPGVAFIENYNTQMRTDIMAHTDTQLELPQSDVIKVIFEDDSWFAVRPSGTEPKIKFYISCVGDKEKTVEENIKQIENQIDGLV